MIKPLDAEIWRQVSPLLDHALELDGTARDEYLADLRRAQPALATVLAELLAEHDGLCRVGFLESPPASRAAARTADLQGTTVSVYTLETPLGDGGMGSVWRARRSDGRFDGHVAIKLLQLSLVDSGGAERFTREGTLLARLSHANIARLLDAGVTSAGQPYLVLEYVDGAHIDRQADDTKMNVRARLNLFRQVAAAVAHAHAHLIVHRDVKPSNILVDRSGQVKLLDFGIAKLLDDTSAASDLTIAGVRPWTPAYASPEQVRGEPITTVTDVYALGVLLYNLLVDGHPTGEGCTTPVQYMRAILEIDPVLPSAALAAAPADAAARIAAARGTTPDGLRRLLRGDLDNILAMALQKDPGRRYATVTAFADDVRRYLADEPVQARPDRWSYRVGKFVRRHRVATASAVAVAITLAAAAGIATERMIEARRQRDEAAYQGRRAQASSEFMRNLVAQIGATPMTMAEVLGRGRQALEQQYGHDPAFVARMLVLLSGPYIDSGDEATASEMVSRALALATEVGDTDLVASTRCVASNSAVEERRLADARVHLAEARRQIEGMTSPRTGVLRECAIAESQLAEAEERYPAAIDHAARAVALMERDGNTASTGYTSALNNLAWMYSRAGQLTESVRVQRQVNVITRRIGRGRTAAMIASLSNEGSDEWLLGWWLEAEGSYREALDLVGERSNASTMMGYGRVLVSLGRTAEGKEWLQKALARTTAAPRFLNAARLSLAAVLVGENDLAGARDQFGRADRELRASPTPFQRVTVTMVRAQLAAAGGSLEEARALVAAGLAAEGYPDRQSQVVHALLEYGARLALQAGDHEQAARLARAAIAVSEQYFLTEQPSAYTGRARMTLGLALSAAGQAAAANRELDRAAAAIAASAGSAHPWVNEIRARR